MKAREATRRSKCAACGEWIEEGEQIVLHEDGDWIHEECAE